MALRGPFCFRYRLDQAQPNPIETAILRLHTCLLPGSRDFMISIAPKPHLSSVFFLLLSLLTPSLHADTTDIPATQPAIGAEGAETGETEPAAASAVPLLLLGKEIPPGQIARLAWQPQIMFSGIQVPTPVLVVHGAQPGPVQCLTAAIHGDELNGTEIVRRIMYDIDPQKLHGTVIGIPIVNLQGFERGSRYLSDRRDLNRYFPGTPLGSMASRVAHSLFTEVIAHCNGLIDLHTASFHRTNLPQVRADRHFTAVAMYTEGFERMVVVHNAGGTGTLRRAAVNAGINAVTLETGEPQRLQEDKVQAGIAAIFSLLKHQKMYVPNFSRGNPQPIYYRSRWVRTQHGGILMSSIKLGGRVKEGEILGTVVDPISNHTEPVISPYSGRIIGMAVNQVVMPGFAAYHVGLEASEKILSIPEENVDTASDDETNEQLAPEE